MGNFIERFPEVWVYDFEFTPRPGNPPDVLCLVAREVRSGRVVRLWQDELKSMPHPPYPVGSGSLHVHYQSLAELGCHWALGWELPRFLIDLLVEFRRVTNGTAWREGQRHKHGLLHACQYYGVGHEEEAAKADMQMLAANGGPFGPDDRRRLMEYCAADVDATTAVLLAMENDLQFPASLYRGDAVRATAKAVALGIPFDSKLYSRLRGQREEIKAGVIDRVNNRADVYRGTTFKADLMEAFVERHGLHRWPRLKSGALSLSGTTWERMIDQNPLPLLSGLYDVRRTVGHLRESSLPVGDDGRQRADVMPFGTTTGRFTWKSKTFVFGQPGWFRGFVQPEPGKALIYADYGSQETAIAAVLSRDKNLAAAYHEGDIYLAFGKQAGLLPPDASKTSHAEERRMMKPCVLGLQYGLTEKGLAERLDIPLDYAAVYRNAHLRTYADYWQWVHATQDQALAGADLFNAMGWSRACVGGWVQRDNTWKQRLNMNAIQNWPVQSGGSAVLQMAMILLERADVRLLATIHDAALVECDATDVEEVSRVVIDLMVEAGRRILHGFELKVDAKIAVYPERLVEDGPARQMWEFVERQLAEG